ncbi:MAG: YkgJ family cysteine cluster protein [Polyangiales bacterium]
MTQASTSKQRKRAHKTPSRPSSRNITVSPRRKRTAKPEVAAAKPEAADGGGSPRRARKAKPAAPVSKPTGNGKQRLPVLKHSPELALGRTPRRASKPHCTACGLCCTYVAIETDGPDTVKQATQLLWYVYHEGVSLYANGDDWMVQFDSTCVHLQPDYRCGIYHTRPHICREFSERDCEINTGDDGHTFYNGTEFMAYLKQIRPRVYSFVRKHFAPPEEGPRTQPEPFEQRFRAVHQRRQTLGAL